MSAACNLLHPTWNADCKASDNVTTCRRQPQGSHGTWPVVVAAAAAAADANYVVARQWMELRP